MSEIHVINNKKAAIVKGSGTSHIQKEHLSCYNMIAGKIFAGSELTISYKTQEAWLDGGCGPAEVQGVPFNYAMAIVDCGFVGLDSGNFETGEKHYTFFASEVKPAQYREIKKKYSLKLPE